MLERSERRWLGYFALAVIIITTLPYLVGYSRQGAGWRYTGMLFGVEDGNSYIAKMLRGASGDWLFRTPYTPYPQNGALVFFPLILLGKLTAAPGQHEQLVALFHLFRAGSIFLSVFATYDFLALFLREQRWRRLGTALVALGGGLGWLNALGLRGLWGGSLPLDFYSPEAFGFLMLFGLPHLAAARAFLLWGLRDYLEPGDAPRGWRGGLKTFLLWLGVGLMQPLTAVTGWVVIAAHIGFSGIAQAWQQKRAGGANWIGAADWATWRQYFFRAARTGLLSAPLVVYTFLAMRLDPFLRGWENQNRLAAPPVTHYLLAYALLLPLVVLGARPLLKAEKWKAWLVIGWVVVAPVLIYTVESVQRRLIEGTWLALLVLALSWVESRGAHVQRWIPRLLNLAYLSTVFLILGSLMAAWNPGEPLFRPQAEIQAFQYLAGSARPSDVVLSAYETANPLPAWAAVHTVIGHGPESIGGDALKKRVACFYAAGCPGMDRLALLRELGVRYIIWGPRERALGNWNLRGADYLEQVYNENDYAIFIVHTEKNLTR